MDVVESLLNEPAGTIHQPHLLDGSAFGVEQRRIANEHGDALRSRHRDVEAVQAEQELDAARRFRRRACRDGVEHDGGLLALELVHRPDCDVLVGDALAQAGDLLVVRGDY